ncbi:MAG: universal stress protein [Deltaproteobacteria bacterium]|nr:universal stress protein [Deltaproteobacteria bacterium]
MTLIKKIIAAVDFSDHGEIVLRRAVALTQSSQAELHVLHVLPDLPYEGATQSDEIVTWMNQWEEEATEKLNQKILEVVNNQVEVNSEVRVGVPFRETLHYANQIDADLILIGSEGKSGISSLLLGKTAESVARNFWRPVWIERVEGPSSIQEILVPVDLSQLAHETVEEAIQWAKFFKFKLHLLHVMQMPYLPSYSLVSAERFDKSLRNIGKEHFQNFIEKLNLDGVDYEIHFREGDPVSEVMRFINEKKISLMALGSRGQTDLSPKLLGSVALDLLRHAPASILLLRPKSLDLSWLRESFNS